MKTPGPTTGDARAPRLLGVAFLFVVATSLASGVLILSATGAGSMSDMLVSISNAPGLMRTGVLAGLVTSLGIIILAALLYVVLSGQSRAVALVTMGWWLAGGDRACRRQDRGLGPRRPGPGVREGGAPVGSYYQT
jgi:hypothetical protein